MGPRDGIQFQNPPPDFYSPHACGNCHTDSSENVRETYRTPPSDLHPKLLLMDEFLPSPSDCPAEIFWPDSLKSYSTLAHTNPAARSQIYLETLLESRKGQFPANVEDASLQVYLGMKGGVSLPLPLDPRGVQLAQDGEICAGAAKLDPGEKLQCHGLAWDLRQDDVGILLGNQDLLTAQGVQAQPAGRWWKVVPGGMLPGVEIRGGSVREGRLIVSLKLSDPLINAALATLPVPLNPNPYDPEIWDLDLTDVLLKNLPVAFDPTNGKSYKLEEYSQETNKDPLKTIPYFFQLAREGRIPDRLSLSNLYESILEWRRLAPRPKDKPKLDLEKWRPLLDSLQVEGKFRLGTLAGFGAFAEFAPDPDQNIVTAGLETKDLQTFDTHLTAPLHLTRLFLPHRLDVTDLKGTVEVYSEVENQWGLQLHDLSVELGPMEYGTPGPAAPGLFAIRGGRITSPQTIQPGMVVPTPALKVTGDLVTGWEVEYQLVLDKVKLRLPAMGEISLSGQLEGHFKIRPETVGQYDANGKLTTRPAYRLSPEGMRFNIHHGQIENTKGILLQDLSVEISTPEILGAWDQVEEPVLNFAFEGNRPGGNAPLPVRFSAGVPVPLTLEGNLDFVKMLENLDFQISGNLEKENGLRQDWNVSVKGSVEEGFADYHLKVMGTEVNTLSDTKRDLIRDLQVDWLQERTEEGSTTRVALKAPRLEIGDLQLNHPEMALRIEQSLLPDGQKIWKVPVLKITANEGPGVSAPRRGILQGPFWFKTLRPEKNPMTILWNPSTSILEFKNVRIGLGAERITPPQLLKMTKGKIGSLDIDGELRADWKANLRKMEGRGKISLIGDNEGDIHLRNSKGVRLEKPDPRDPAYLVETPMFANTVWTLSQMWGLDPAQNQIKGRFRLKTDIDPAVARIFGIIIDAGKVLSWEMNHDHLPYSQSGFGKKMEEYLRKKFSQEMPEEDTE